jgi:hypothetical protein
MLTMNAAKMTDNKCIWLDILCHIFSEIVESERHVYHSVIRQQLGNEVGFFQ